MQQSPRLRAPLVVAAIVAACFALAGGCEAVLGVGGLHVVGGDSGDDGSAADGPATDAVGDGANADASSDGSKLVVLATGLLSPTAIAVDGQNVFFVDGATVRSVSVNGGSPVVVGQGTSLTDVAVDDMYVYWTDSKGVTRANKNGAMALPIADASMPAYVAADGTYVCAVDPQGIQCGGKNANLATVAPVPSLPGGIVLHDGVAYWTNASVTAAIYSIPAKGQAVTAFIDGGPAYRIAVNDTTLFYTVQGAVAGAALSAPMPFPVGSTPGGSSVAADDARVYWTIAGDGGAGSVMYAELGDGGVNTLASGLGTPDGIALDPNNVYWTDTSAGTVMKVAKP